MPYPRDLVQLLGLIEQEAMHAPVLRERGIMWSNAAMQFREAADSMRNQTMPLFEQWGASGDKNGVTFHSMAVADADKLQQWATQITTAAPWAALGDLSVEIDKAHVYIADLLRQFNEQKAYVDSLPPSVERDYAVAALAQLEQDFIDEAIRALGVVDGFFQTAAEKVADAGNGPTQMVLPINAADIVTGPSPSTAPDDRLSTSSTTSPDTSPGGGQSGGPAATDGGAAPGATGGAPAGGAPAGGAPAGGAGGGSPALSGLGTGGGAPTLPPGLGQTPTIPPPGATPPSTIPPFVPMVPSAGGYGNGSRPAIPGSGIGGGGGGVGGGGGGARVPGVSVGGGPANIAQAAAPVPAPATPTVSGAPAMPTTGGGGGGSPTGMSTGGVPPMMPPMGGMGAGGGGGGGGPRPGSGATQRPGGRSRSGQNATPGLPALLQGKAGKQDAFTARASSMRQRDQAAPATVQLIEEDLWQVDPTPAPAPARRART